MTRLAPAAFAVVAFVVPLLTARSAPVIAAGLFGVLLAAVGIATLWRWPVTAAACVFMTDFAAALWLAGSPLSLVRATAFGLALLLLLESAELARCTRRSMVDVAVLRSQIVGWVAFAAGTLAAAMLVLALAGGLVAAIPVAMAPFIAAAGALGVVLTLAAAMRGAWRRREAGPHPTEVA
jgi:hypothetical protein